MLIALGLSADCFAVAISGSVSREKLPLLSVIRASIVFGTFQALMAVSGWFVGRTILELISEYDHWLAFALLSIIGGKMVWESFHSADNGARNTDITRGFLLLTLAVATSIDALAIGLTFAFMKINITLAGITIGLVTLIVSVIGFWIGKNVGRLVGSRAEMVGGLVLIGIGIKILLEHTW